MKALHKSQWKFMVTVVVTVLILTPGFYRNQWLAAGKKWFFDWRKIQESMMIARLVESRGTGVFSYGALLGFGNITTWDPNSPLLKLDVEQIYLDNGRFHSYFPYTSNPAIQGVFLGLFNQLVNVSPKLSLNLFHGAESIVSAFVLSLLIYWIICELGWLSGFSTLLFIAFSEWMTLFGGNIYWNLWAFYLPLVAVSFYLINVSKTDNYRQLTMSIILFISVLIKCLFTGFEYISTALLMTLIPFIFYAIRDAWSWNKLVYRFIWSSISLIAGAAAGLVVLVLQIRQIKANFFEAAATILDALGKRTYGDPTQYTNESAGLNAKLLPVLNTYINGRAILFSQTLHLKGMNIEVSYLSLFVVFAIFTVILLLALRAQMNTNIRRTGYAFIGTSWISIMAPLSWFILFKAHSYIHTQMNYIIWQMPFTLYGFALCGFAVQVIYQSLAKNLSHDQTVAESA